MTEEKEQEIINDFIEACIISGTITQAIVEGMREASIIPKLNSGEKGKIANLPNGTIIIPNSKAKKTARKEDQDEK